MVVWIFFAECSFVEVLAVVIDELGKGCDLEVLADVVDDSLFFRTDFVFEGVVHDVGVVFSEDWYGPWFV